MKKYYKQTITFEILADEDPLNWDLVQDFFATLMTKKCSSLLKTDEVKEIDKNVMAQLLEENGTNINFFS